MTNFCIRSVLVFSLLVFGAASVSAQVIKSGTIRGQSVEWTTGSVEIAQTATGYEVRLGNDFKTKRGPSLWIYFGNEKPEKRVDRIKSVTGAQTFRVPSSADPKLYSKLFIYCVPFNAVFGVATLE
ncbi:MAG: DM13 domain-containing protein [Pseudomonadota bacterium]